MSGKGGDPTKSKKQKKKELKRRLEGTRRIQMQKGRLRKLRRIDDGKQGRGHCDTLMESFIIRRKEELKQKRREERAAEKEQDADAEDKAAKFATKYKLQPVAVEDSDEDEDKQSAASSRQSKGSKTSSRGGRGGGSAGAGGSYIARRSGQQPMRLSYRSNY